MSRVLHWSLLGGCLSVAALTARPAWDVFSCPSPLASLCSDGCAVRLPGSLAQQAKPVSPLRMTPRNSDATEDLALVDVR